jgi:apolipoprotein D and lipocalin family protein
MKYLVFFLFATIVPFANADTQDVPDTVHYVDLERYSGTWYEVARYPNSFQADCEAVRATYTLKSHKVAVLNECRLGGPDGEVKSAKGTAFVVDKQSQSKLKVSFVPLLRHFGIFAGEYWVLELDSDYRYALVGDSQREYLWILSRTPEIPESVLEEYKFLAKQKGFDPERLQVTPTW